MSYISHKVNNTKFTSEIFLIPS